MSDPRSAPTKYPVCTNAADGTPGLGCPNCNRFEVRRHEAGCPDHGEHMELACCWCGTVFFAFYAIEHDHEEDGALTDRRETVQ